MLIPYSDNEDHYYLDDLDDAQEHREETIYAIDDNDTINEEQGTKQ